MIGRIRSLALTLALALAAAPAAAQSPARADVSLQPPAPTDSVRTQQADTAAVGPVLRTSAVSAQPSHPAKAFDMSAALAGGSNPTQSRAMMIVGGAALVVGAIIGGTPGTIIMVGGAAVGLIGLYDYLQ